MTQITLRPYQESSINELRQGFVERNTRQVLAAPTGAGKSQIMLAMIRKAIEKKSRVMFMCERRILVDQFSKHLDSAGIDHGIMMAKHWRFRPYELVQIASAQTLEKMTDWPDVDILFIDELHACMRASIIKLIEQRPTLKIVGATATPFHPAIGKYFSSVTSVTTMSALVKEDFLVPFRVFVAKEIDTRGLKVVAGEWKKDDLEKRGQEIIGDVVADYIRISTDVFGEFRKTICFSCGIAHGADLAAKFIEAGINAIQISSNDEEDYRKEVLAEFAKADSDIKILISVAILSRGFDQTDVEHVILARPLKKSFSEHVQMVGRGARTHNGKNFCVIQDNSGNWLRFKDDWETLYHDGVTDLQGGQDSKAKKEPTEKEKAAAKCPKCGHLWSPSSNICSNCGLVRSKKSDVIAIAGEMVELGSEAATKAKKDQASPAMKETFFQELLGYAKFYGYKDGWAFHKYQEKFGLKPPWKKVTRPASITTTNWIKSRSIAYNKAAK